MTPGEFMLWVLAIFVACVAAVSIYAMVAAQVAAHRKRKEQLAAVSRIGTGTVGRVTNVYNIPGGKGKDGA